MVYEETFWSTIQSFFIKIRFSKKWQESRVVIKVTLEDVETVERENQTKNKTKFFFLYFTIYQNNV